MKIINSIFECKPYNVLVGGLTIVFFLLVACDSRDVRPPESDNNEGLSDETADSFLGFYDKKSDGDLRSIRHDLEGDLPAMVQFIQSHTVDPFASKIYTPERLTSKREALLLVTPDTSLVNVGELEVTLSIKGVEKSTLDMRPPKDIFKADRSSDESDSRPEVRYSKRAWSVVLPWKWVKPGLSLTVKDGQDRKGTTPDISFAPPSELVINNIRLGMLSSPPRSRDHAMFLRPAKAGTDYFQTIPLSRMVVAKYDEITLDSVMVADGTIYTGASTDEGGVYSGDMRENTAKSTFSVGINLANWGITSSSMASQQQPQLTQTVIVHHAQGRYSNGVQTHGLSGGNGMLTLLKSTGNEFSHEIGHHFGLGHYPGKYQHGSNCCWGYIGHRERMRANLNWETDTLDSGGGFRGMYSYVKSPMAGGSNYSEFSKYTYYTGYDVKNEIIPSLNSPIFSSQSSTGYRKWKDGVERMEDYRPKTPSSEEVWYNSEDGKYRVPKRQGVKVFSILGGYDPTEGVGLLYPPARSNWGNVFDLPAPDEINSSTRQCWLSVDYEAKNSEEIALAPKRLGSQANKLHVQIAVDQNPEKAQLYCQEPGRDAQLLSKTSFPQNLESIEDPVVIGQENEYEAYEEVE